MRRHLILVGFVWIFGCDSPAPASGPLEVTDRSGTRIDLDSPSIIYGDSATYGSVQSAVVLKDGRVAVLDAMNGRVALHDTRGVIAATFGRRGAGPGEFFRAVRLDTVGGDLLVLDPANLRLSRLALLDDSIALMHEIRLPFRPVDMCVLGDQLHVLGLHENRLLHVVDDDGLIVRSYGEVTGGDNLGGALSTTGYVACAPSGDAIAAVPRTLNSFRIFDKDGVERVHERIPGYVETRYEGGPAGFRPLPNEEGYAHGTAGLVWLDSTRVLVQLERFPPASSPEWLASKVYELQSGWAAAPDSKLVLATSPGKRWVRDHDPFPTVGMYDVN